MRTPPDLPIEPHLGALRRYARSLTRDENTADDLVQEALLQAYVGRESFDPARGLRAWLLSITHNVFVSGLRRRRAEEARLRMAADTAVQVHPADQEDRLQVRQVHEHFLRLPEDQRAALHLVAIEGLSYREAADILGIPQGTLMSRIARARDSLRSMSSDARPGSAGRPKLTVMRGGQDG